MLSFKKVLPVLFSTKQKCILQLPMSLEKEYTLNFIAFIFFFTAQILKLEVLHRLRCDSFVLKMFQTKNYIFIFIFLNCFIVPCLCLLNDKFGETFLLDSDLYLNKQYTSILSSHLLHSEIKQNAIN